MGLRSLEDGYVPPILDVSKLDRKLLVSNDEAAAAVRALLDREGHLRRRLGRSCRARRTPHRGRAAGGLVVVCVLADGGWKYLSAPFWSPTSEESMEATLWW